MRNHARRAECSRYIDRQIEKTGRQVKLTEVFGGLFLLAVGLLVFFLAAAVIDHWIVPLRAVGRWGLLLLLIGGVVAFVVLRLLPLVFRRVNPVYSAHTIERHAPAMKNSLVNHLVLRRSGQGVSKGVRRAVEEQAAQRLSQAPVDSAVDRGRVIRLGYLLLVLAAVAALYKFLSPKDPLSTFGRIAAPWSDIDAPTRVVIEQVRHNANPADANSIEADAGGPAAAWVYADQKPVEVEATVRGLKNGEEVTLYWSTEDGRVDRQPIVMRPQGDDDRHFRCYLPDENIGLRQDVRFFVAAGDARSAEFRIEVRTPPVIAIKSVEYRYPAYTLKRPETRVGGGDIAALLGTTVTLHAEANQPIKSATVDLGGDGNIDHTMQIAGTKATATFRLANYPQGNGPTSYLVRMTNAQGHENPQPIRYSLEIILDRPPTVKITEPAARELQLPLNGGLPMIVQAHDVDFALSSVRVVGVPADSPNGALLFDALISEEAAAGFAKEFANADEPFEFRPQSKQLSRELKVGDVVHIWAVARDNKHNLKDELEPNVVLSEKLVVHIIAPTEQPPDKKQSKDQGEKKDSGSKKEQSKGQKQDDGSKGQSDKKQDKKKQDDGKQGKEKGKEKSGDKQPGEKSPDNKQNGSGSKQPDQKQEGDKQDGKSKEQPKSGGGPKDMNELFNELHREAQQKKKEQEKAGGSADKQKGSGSDSPPPDGAKSPQEKSPAGGGSNKQPGKKTNPNGGGDSSSETVEPKTGDPGSVTKGKTSDNVGRNKTANENFAGSESTGGKDTPSVKTPPSDPSESKQPGAKENSKGKAADEASKQPSAKPMSNPDAVGNKAGSAPNTAIPDEQSAKKPKDAGTKESAPSVPQAKTGTGGNADRVDDPSPTAKGLSDTKTKIGNKEPPPDESTGQKQPGAKSTAPSTDDKESDNKNKSGTKDGNNSGGSAPGGGQRGKEKGTGASGTNEEANDGMGAGKSEGVGETGKAPGNKVKADAPTGSSGNEAGNGSDTRQSNNNPGAAKAPTDLSPGGSDADSGSTGGGGKQDSSGGRGSPETGPGDGRREFGKTQPTEPDLEAAKKAIDLVLDHIKDHPDEARFQEPRVIELASKLRALRDAADQAGPEGDIARRQLRSMSHGFSTRGMNRDTVGGLSTLRGARPLPGYSEEYLERSGARPARKVP